MVQSEVKKMVDDFLAYMRRLLGLNLALSVIPPRNMPFYLSELYDYRLARIENKSLVFCFLRGTEAPTPIQLAEHEHRLRNAFGFDVVFVFPELDSRKRRRLIEERIPFAVPGTQLYLPSLLIDLREQFNRVRKNPEYLSWPAQVLLIRWLLDPSIEGKALRELAKLLGYSPISMSRAMDELLTLDLVRTNRGKSKPALFDRTKAELWNAALPYMRSPIKEMKAIPMDHVPNDWPRAGLAALSRLSPINEDRRDCRAALRAVYDEAIERSNVDDAADESRLVDIEVWAYEPRCAYFIETVDPYSLFLSLRSDNDERVAKSLNDLMKGLL